MSKDDKKYGVTSNINSAYLYEGLNSSSVGQTLLSSFDINILGCDRTQERGKIMSKKYEVTIKEKEGTCNNSLFEKMAKRGDVNAEKLVNFVNKVITLKGYSAVTVETDEKTFDNMFYDTEEYGFISSGSQYFYDSVKEYFGEVKRFRICEIKTKQGKTYKVQPILEETSEKKQETENEKEETSDDLPF
mgnify:CR=1 FL=1